MRTYLVAVGVAVAAVLGAAAPGPEKIVFARVFPQPGQIGLFIAAADGSDERPLLASPDIDYDAAWSPDGASIVFTSERGGSADLYRVKADGSGLEQLTDSPAYDDQAAFSPDGKQLVFVTTRNGGTSDLWTLDLQTRRARALTSGPGGDFRPSWSPDGKWIAFSSDRESNLPFAHGRWEHLHLVDLYVVRPDGSGLKRITEHGHFCGSPKWSADSRRVLAYCMTAEQTLDDRRAVPEHADDTRLVSIDVATGVASDLPAGAGVKFNPSFLPAGTLGYIRKDGADPGIFYSNGTRGPKGQIRTASWSPDGRRVVFHKKVAFTRKPWVKTFSRNPNYELTLTAMQPAFNPSGDRFAVVAGASANNLGAGIAVAAAGGDKSDIIFQDKTRNVLGPQWSPRGDTIIFGIGIFNAFFNGFHGLFLTPEDRAEGGAQIAMINADGSGFRELTKGPNNNGFPSMSPDGKQFVYRSFGPDGDGLRIMNVETKTSTMLSNGYDNFPLWSPRGDLIMFSRLAEGNYEIYSIKPDGASVKRLTNARGNDAHMAWSPDGEFIVFASTRMGFKDEMTYTDAPQPYGEIFVMRYDGTNVQQLTDNQWEDGTPAWQPTRPRSSSSRDARDVRLQPDRNP
jgi:Tol biopolymer transport system component